MNPLSLRCENYRSFRSLDITFPDGLVALCGPNGAGKTSAVLAIDVALFGPEGRSLAPYYCTDGDGDMVIELRFEHAGSEYAVRRVFSPSGRGKSATDFEQRMVADLVDGPAVYWRPLTRESQDETQAVIEQVLGFGRESFRASSFLAQGAGAAFCEAAPRDRKRILGDVLGLGRWDTLLEVTRARKREQEQRAASLRDAIQRAENELADRDTYSTTLLQTTQAAAKHAIALTDAEDLLFQVSERFREVSGRAAARGNATTALRTALDNLERLRQSEFAAAHARWRELTAERDRLLARANDVEADKARMGQEAHTLAVRADEMLQRAAALDELPGIPCDRCGQALHDAAKLKAQESYRAEAASLDSQAVQVRAKITALPSPVELRQQAEAFSAGPEPDIATHDFGQQLDTAREAVHDANRALMALPAVTDQEIKQVQTDGLNAKAEVEQHRQALETARAEKIRLETILARLDDVSKQHDADREDLSKIEGELALLALEERSRGHNGIPLLILENSAIPSIEIEANRILAELGTAYRVELRTQAATKTTDTLRDTLDVIVYADEDERDFATYSGGERTRIALALRIALARLLANRRGAESRLLCIDEPDGLDADGMTALVSVLRGLQHTFSLILVISHQQALQDAFDTTIQVEKTPGGSRLAGDREKVPA